MGFRAANTVGSSAMWTRPTPPMVTNHSVITGPKNAATRAVPRDCTANNASRMITVSGTTYSRKCGAPTSKPSTAENTEMAGVMSASP